VPPEEAANPAPVVAAVVHLDVPPPPVVVKQPLVEINPRNINKTVAVVAVVESRPEKIDAPLRSASLRSASLIFSPLIKN